MDIKEIRRLTILLTLGVLIPVPVLAETLFAITVNANDETRLVSFDSATPGTLISGPTLITGLATGEGLIGIDVRPFTKRLYGLATDGVTPNYILYTIDTATGVATARGTGFTSPSNFALPGFDFNPVTDQIRVITEDGQNFRLDLDTGAIVDTDAVTPGVQQDSPLAFAAGDANFGDTPITTGAAYTNNFAGATSTSLYAIDSFNNTLAIQGGPGGSPSPNGGQLFTVGSPLAIAQTPLIGFDISQSGAAFLSATTAADSPGDISFTGSTLYTLDLGGGTRRINAIGSTADIGVLDIAVAPPGVQFSAGSFNVNENAGTASITITRTNGSAGAVTVNFATSDGTALATSDYTASSNVISFADGDAAPKTVLLPITNDTTSEGNETVNLSLSLPTGNVILGAVATANLVITDDDRNSGGGGGGCVINTRIGFDPLLPGILLLSLGYLLRRRFDRKI